jgi:hypothetical protein
LENLNQYSISFSPSKLQFKELEIWLIEEQNATGEGFNYNWSIIKNFFERNNLVVLLNNDLPNGFV